MFKTGLICKKIAGKEKGKVCIVLKMEKDYVIVDGDCRKRKCSIKHLEPLSFAEIKRDAPHDEVMKVLEAAGFKSKKQEKKKWNKKHKEK
ncbi:MAG: 50S ribosomal protein L14e [Nanoarchaeota archaeon]|nr:50S ribosomal protein L14e [Nanoarchaeota archaeon]